MARRARGMGALRGSGGVSLLAVSMLAMLAAAAVACALALPPLVAFQPRPLPALALVLVGAALALFPGRWPKASWLRASGAALLWGIIVWCVFSQEAPLTAPRGLILSERALPLAIALGLWLGSLAHWSWQRRGLLALALPTLVGLTLAAWSTTPRVSDFAPYYVAVDGAGTIYASDAHAAVVRVFAPDGTLRAKLRPAFASVAGPLGRGFDPPGPYNDPDRLGVARSQPGAGSVSATLRPWPLGADDFWFCGMAADGAGRLSIPDWMRGRMLIFRSDGHLDATWPLPAGYAPSLGCVAAPVDGDQLYLGDKRGTVLAVARRTGAVRQRWEMPEPIIGGISVTPCGDALYALARVRVYRLDLRAGALTSWPLPTPAGPLGQPYQGILARGDGRVLVANLGARRVDMYATDGRPLGALGRAGAWPGEFGQVGGLAADRAGHTYVADADSRALQRFTPTGHVDALYRGPDDDESE
jgi:hypothetical protein